MSIIEELNYAPNAAARSLVSDRSRIIALLVPNMMLEGGFGVDPYASAMISLLELLIQKEGYYTMVRSVNRALDMTQLVYTWHVDGIIILGAYPDEAREISSQIKDIPLVYTDTYSSQIPIANIGIDDYKGGYLSASYLLKKGHRKICFVGPDEKISAVISERCRGFRAALQEYGLKLDPEDIYTGDTSIDAGAALGKQIAASPKTYTAIAAMSDTLALGICGSLHECGLAIPDDISIIGFDDIKACAFTNPRLTSIHQDLDKKASLVCKHLFEMIRTRKAYSINEVLDVRVTERQSVKEPGR